MPQNSTACFTALVKNIEFKGRVTAIQISINGCEIWLESSYLPNVDVGDKAEVYLQYDGLFYA